MSLGDSLAGDWEVVLMRREASKGIDKNVLLICCGNCGRGLKIWYEERASLSISSGL